MMKKIITTYLIYILLLFIACQSESNPSESAESIGSNTLPEINQLNELLKLHPDEGDLWFQRGSLYYEMEKYAAAVSDLEKAIQLDSSDIEAWHLLADALMDNLQSREALQTMETVRERFPGRIPSLLKFSEFQLILRRYQDAFNTLDRIQKIDPLNADAFFMKGMVMKETGDTTQAIQYFQAATKENPEMIDAWINLGQLHEALSDSNAVRYFDAGLSVSPEDPLILHAKAQYLARRSDIEEAKGIYRLMMELSPYDSEPYFDLGLLYLDQDSLVKAVNHFDLTIKINPMFSRAYFYRGLTQELMGKNDAARQDYEQTLQINPNDKDASEALTRLTKNL